MRYQSRLRGGVRGPLEAFVPGFSVELARLGYTPVSASLQLNLMAHLSGWLTAEGLDAAGLSDEAVERFMAGRRADGFTNHRTARSLAPLLGYLRSLGAAAPSVGPPPDAVELLLDSYRVFLLSQRGLASSTVEVYVRSVRPFIATRQASGGLALDTLTPGDVTAFVQAANACRRPTTAALVMTALRSLLVFLHVAGLVPTPLQAAVPLAARWRLAGLPKSLTPGEVQRLLAACDRRTRLGRRNYAMLLVLIRLGLRAGEVAALGLDDIDWRAGEIVVRGKGDRLERLPLPVDVGEAIAGYLRCGRPAIALDRRVFIRVRAPHRGLPPAAVSDVVASVAARAGLEGFVGAHKLRHTTATSMVAAGATLADVGQVLRHRRLMTTAIYAKVDRDGLRLVARAWPGSTP
jgi:site-specific recombinase XerD